jgi:hypothetical protein
MFTDSDAAMKAAIAQVFYTTIHLLCIFHLWKNFYAHIMPLIRYSNMEDRQRVTKMFWRLAKDSDDDMTKTFDAEFVKMSNEIMVLGKKSGISEVSSFLHYLRILYLY